MARSHAQLERPSTLFSHARLQFIAQEQRLYGASSPTEDRKSECDYNSNLTAAHCCVLRISYQRVRWRNYAPDPVVSACDSNASSASQKRIKLLNMPILAPRDSRFMGGTEPCLYRVHTSILRQQQLSFEYREQSKISTWHGRRSSRLPSTVPPFATK